MVGRDDPKAFSNLGDSMIQLFKKKRVARVSYHLTYPSSVQ